MDIDIDIDIYIDMYMYIYVSLCVQMPFYSLYYYRKATTLRTDDARMWCCAPAFEAPRPPPLRSAPLPR